MPGLTSTRVDAERYNYRAFPYPDLAREFRAWIDALRVTQPAPDFDAFLLDGNGVGKPRTVRLSDFTRDGPAVVEFGSIT